MQNAADTLARSNIGYDQWQRWSFFQNGRIVAGKEADCSSICGAIMKLGGYPVDLSGTWYTGNMIAKCKAAGFTVLKFRSLSQLRPGDFVINVTHHVEFVRDKNRFFSARIDERGKGAGGQAGNQTGKETGFVPAYIYSRGWDYILRPPADGTATTTPANTTSSVGCVDTRFVSVKTVQTRLKGLGFYRGVIDGIDGDMTRNAILAYQNNQRYHPNLLSDGKWGALEEKHYQWVATKLQPALNGWKTAGRMGKVRTDGDYGSYTARLVLQTQKDNLNGAYRSAVQVMYGAGSSPVADGDPGKAFCKMLGIPSHPTA